MENKHKQLLPIPAQRYFTLDELCRLADISAEQFSVWQQIHGVVVGYGGQHYTRADVIKIRQLRNSFKPYTDPFTRNQVDADGNPAIEATEVRQQIEKVVDNLNSVLAK
ncbi:hypothetical protein BGI40_09465 [Snodgrassella communis]|uniref:HTH merR-type domain-containing protein n=1 Tax=Snodgrassella communis TaxID=2946699 RepID=A0A836MRA4_9NEIS|nr:hypothetical protein [Snodgrassella communis]KDN15304.1 hypothetical protein SALWKB29_0408 [Snodgrassella communis]PIT09335.1 hypothetical protein BGI29_06080 [Snodgrassella communis]PIT26391.1 hypothetical protein BGI38_07505 [Snodgrassella communis]PIT28693.1 hypothetical protein BGI39_05860 [Snodgrassella communis]PIT31170.1 hypothetical protein BGI40_09465 [Snodgrassella communis]